MNTVDHDEVLCVLEALIDTVQRTTDLKRVYDDKTGNSFSMDYVLEIHRQLSKENEEY